MDLEGAGSDGDSAVLGCGSVCAGAERSGVLGGVSRPGRRDAAPVVAYCDVGCSPVPDRGSQMCRPFGVGCSHIQTEAVSDCDDDVGMGGVLRPRVRAAGSVRDVVTGMGCDLRTRVRVAGLAGRSRGPGNSSVPSGRGSGSDEDADLGGEVQPRVRVADLGGGSRRAGRPFEPSGSRSESDEDADLGGESRHWVRAAGLVGGAPGGARAPAAPSSLWSADRCGGQRYEGPVVAETSPDRGGPLGWARAAGPVVGYDDIGGSSTSPATRCGEGGRSSPSAASSGGRGDRTRGQVGTGASVRGMASASTTPPDWPAWIQLLGGNRQLAGGNRQRWAGARGWKCAFGDGDASPRPEQ